MDGRSCYVFIFQNYLHDKLILFTYHSLLCSISTLFIDWLAYHSFKAYYFPIYTLLTVSSFYYLPSYFLLFFNFLISYFFSKISCFSALFSYSIVTGPLFIEPTYIKCWNFPVWTFFSSYLFFKISTNFSNISRAFSAYIAPWKSGLLPFKIPYNVNWDTAIISPWISKTDAFQVFPFFYQSLIFSTLLAIC